MATAAGKVSLNFLAVYIERLNFVWNDNLKYVQALEILWYPYGPISMKPPSVQFWIREDLRRLSGSIPTVYVVGYRSVCLRFAHPSLDTENSRLSPIFNPLPPTLSHSFGVLVLLFQFPVAAIASFDATFLLLGKNISTSSRIRQFKPISKPTTFFKKGNSSLGLALMFSLNHYKANTTAKVGNQLEWSEIFSFSLFKWFDCFLNICVLNYFIFFNF